MDAVTVTANDGEHIRRMFENRMLVDSFDRVIVVDNACDDDSAEIARAGGGTVVRREERGGYGQCINTGYRAVGGGEFFCVLNPDILFLEPRTLERLVEHFDEPHVALVSPGLVLPTGQLQDSARTWPTPLDLLLRRYDIDPLRGAIRHGGDVPWTVGAFWVARRSAWDEVGGFDERFFLYFEDVDIAYRLRERGYSVRFDPSVKAIHNFGAASRSSVTTFAGRHHVRSATMWWRDNPRFILTRKAPHRQ
ncbi:MAG: glycosyltransferase family 2 protein [Thermoleophilaceae bacterium]|nr:glycosyltransferase family 2 protein [Thermoleophilaceae bacterium]